MAEDSIICAHRRRYAHTWKKAGWDCMRHVEIIGAGAIPVFRRSHEIPRGIMVGYPRPLLHHIECCHAGASESERVRWMGSLARAFVEHLSAEGLVAYMLEVAAHAARADSSGGASAGVAGGGSGGGAGVSAQQPPPRRVLWISSCAGDYISAAVYVGLVSAWGTATVVESPTHHAWAYDDFSGGLGGLYGGGFSYSMGVNASLRGPHVSLPEAISRVEGGVYDLVVLGARPRG